jgi:hypothetical protein
MEVAAGRALPAGIGLDAVRLARRLVVVDPVVAVAVADVVVQQRVVRARVALYAGVLVVVADVAVDRVAR